MMNSYSPNRDVDATNSTPTVGGQSNNQRKVTSCCFCGDNHYPFKGVRDVFPRRDFPEHLHGEVIRFMQERRRINRETLRNCFGFIPKGFVACPNFCAFCQNGGHSCLDNQAANAEYAKATDKEDLSAFLRYLDDGCFETLEKDATDMVETIGFSRISTVVNCRSLKSLFWKAEPVVLPQPVVVARPVVVAQSNVGKRAKRTFKASFKNLGSVWDCFWDECDIPE
jgi:hypothetical protein